jgi:hypothetical protein
MARNRGFGPPGALERLEQWWYDKTAGDRVTVALCGLAAVAMAVIGLSLLSSGAPPRGQLVASQAPRTTSTFAVPAAALQAPTTLDTTTTSSSAVPETTTTTVRPAATGSGSSSGSGSRTNTTAAPRAPVATNPPVQQNTVPYQLQIPADPGPAPTSPPATSPPATSPPGTSPSPTSPPPTAPPPTASPGTQPVTSTTVLLGLSSLPRLGLG